jgi:hypothetical protein
MKMQFLDEIAMTALGTGLTLSGASMIYIGVTGVKKNFYAAGVAMTMGATLTHIGSQVAIDAVERMRGLQ